MTRTKRIWVKAIVWAVCLTPLFALASRAYLGDLTANPISFITNTLGDWTFRLLLASLALTPLRVLFGISWQVSLRRLLGLFAFLYACLHFSVWIGVDHFFDWKEMGTDILKRPYITVGMLALTSLIPLAATSTKGMVQRLGGTNWRRLHRLVYATGVLAALHFLWLAKKGRTDQFIYVAILTLLLGIRLWDAARRLHRKRRVRRSVTDPAMA
jgi:sulfoxide reductase heme-binding subunit YedZ